MNEFSTKERAEQVLSDASRNWNDLITRTPAKIEVPEWGNADGPATFYLIPQNGYGQSFFTRFNQTSERLQWCAAFITVTFCDMMRQPFFYDIKDKDGKDLDPILIEAQWAKTYDHFMSKVSPTEVMAVAQRAVKALAESLNNNKVSPEEVKNGSIPQKGPD